MTTFRHPRALAGAFAVLIALVTGCAGPVAATPSTPPPEPPAGARLWLSADRVPPDAEVLAVLVGDPAAPGSYGVAATVDRWRDDRWEPLGEVVLCLDFWLCTASLLPEDGDLIVPSIGVGLGAVFRFTTAGLEPGWYRLGQSGDGGARGVFEVSADAADPVPLPPTDTASLSVSPTLVPPDGGSVRLTPLVPDSQSVADVVAATDGLADDVAVERWAGDRWEPVARLALTDSASADAAANPDEPHLERTAELPPLPVGAYRLVRNGPAGDHHGLFWVDPDASAPLQPQAQ